MINELKLQWWVDEAIRDTLSDSIGVSAGLGSGKTHGLCQWHYQRCLDNKDAPQSAFVMPTYQKIFDTAIPTYCKVLNSIGLKVREHFEIVKSPFPKITYNGLEHEVHFLSANNPEHIVGVEYSHAGCSESGSLKEEALNNVIARTRHNKATIIQKLFEGAPQGLNRFADMFNAEELPGWRKMAEKDYQKVFETEAGPVVFRRFRVSTYDNPFIPPSYIPNLLQTYAGRENYIRAYIHGFFVPLNVGNVFGNYNPDLHDLKDRDPDPYLTIYLTFDFNANPMTWVANQEMTFDEYDRRVRKMVAVHENESNTQLDEAISYFQHCFPIELFRETPVRIFGDRSGHSGSHKVHESDYQQIDALLRKLGYKDITICALKYNPAQTVSVAALNNWFLKDYLLICERCVKLRRSLLFTRWKENSSEIDKPGKEDWTHPSDAQKYLAYALQENDFRKVRFKNEIL